LVLLFVAKTLSCDYVYYRTAEQGDLADIVLAHAMRIATILGMHEATPVSDFVEAAVRKRVFWLICKLSVP
jgi:hypothetical protein